MLCACMWCSTYVDVCVCAFIVFPSTFPNVLLNRKIVRTTPTHNTTKYTPHTTLQKRGCMGMCVDVCGCVYTPIQACTCVYIDLSVGCMYIRVHACTRIYMRVHTFACVRMYVDACACMGSENYCACTCMDVHAWGCTCTRVHAAHASACTGGVSGTH